MTEAQKGVLSLLAACTVWGLSPLYYDALAEVPPLEVLSHRTLWSLAVFGVVLALQRRMRDVGELVRGPQARRLVLGTLMISANWYLYINAIQTGHAIQASMGYYIFPLVAVGLGMLAFGERLSALQGVAVGLAAAGIGVLTYGLGVMPWLALLLALTFGVYGMVKKQMAAGPVVSVTAEVLFLAPLAAGWLAAKHLGILPGGGHFGQSLQVSAMLAFSGVITAVPLMLFSHASRRVSMATFGLTQYLNPTLQFLCATLVFAEPFSRWHMAAFALIWGALAVYSLASLRAGPAANPAASAAASAGTSGTTVT